MNKETTCVHSNRNDQGVNTPIYPSTSNKYIGYEEVIYPRYFKTPNQDVIVDKLIRLESAEAGLILSSGMAAISTTIFTVLKPQDHILLSAELYGGTYKFVVEELQKFGITYDFINGVNVDEVEAKRRPNTKAIYTETPSNPLLTIVDLEQIAGVARKYGWTSIVDNTFATPINQNPLNYGIDLVIHSGTKYLGGHSDLCFGAILTSHILKERILNSAVNFGGSLNALDCYMIERSLKTLALRVNQHNSNAQHVAEFLASHESISKVYYPGLPEHPNHAVAVKQMNFGFGGMLSFQLKNPELTDTFLDALQFITPALSLGGVETIICEPSKTSHAKMAVADRIKLGITDGLLRLSVGIEHTEDILADLKFALKGV